MPEISRFNNLPEEELLKYRSLLLALYYIDNENNYRQICKNHHPPDERELCMYRIKDAVDSLMFEVYRNIEKRCEMYRRLDNKR